MNKGAIAVIPARGGSKRIPAKNIYPLAGKPLIAYSVEAALQSTLFDRVIVSTDSEEIASVARTYGAEVPFLRSAEIADDMTPVSAVTADSLERLDPDGRSYEMVCQLMPNCPLRTVEDVIASYRQFCESAADSQISVVRYGWQNPWWAMRRSAASFELEALFPDAMKQRSQDLPELFCPTGAVWWGKTSVIRQQKTFHIAERTGWEIHWQHGIDIDTLDDLKLAEVVLHMSNPDTIGIQ